MPTWNLHVVGQKDVEDLDEIGAGIVTLLESHGHQLVSATLTTDDGLQSLPVSPPEEEVPTDTPPEQSVASGETA
jgi:hypothetical protein